MVRKEIIILGDVEMGGGTITDDFISDKALSTLIISLSKKKHPVDLVFNGDTFDFLKCPYLDNGHQKYTRHITLDVSRSKLALIYKAHKLVFDALTVFARKKKNRLFFITGNHDQDLFYKGIQHELKDIIGAQGNVFFGMEYQQHNVYVEHGQQYDLFNKVNLKHLYLRYKGKPILNIPWTSYGIISHFLPLKEEHPFLERIKPYPMLFKYHQPIIKKIFSRSVEYVLKSIFYFPLRYYFDPTYAFPRMMLGKLYQRLKSKNWDVDQIVDVFKRKRRKKVQKATLSVLGHIHEKFREENDGLAIVHPDTWRDEYVLDEKNKKLIPKTKHYLLVQVDETKKISWKLMPVQIKRSVLNFNDVIADERKFLIKAAQEEGYAYFR